MPFHPVVLEVLPTRTAVRAAEEARLSKHGVCLGHSEVALGDLAEAFLSANGLKPALSAAALSELVPEAAARAGLGEAATRPGGIRALRGLWGRLSAARPPASQTAAQVKSLNQVRLTRLAEGFEVYRRLLDDLDLLDPQTRAWRAGQVCRAGGRWPDLLLGRRGLRVSHVESFSPAHVDLLLALAEKDLRVEIHLPFTPGPSGLADNAAAFRAFERLGEVNLDLELLGFDLSRDVLNLPAGLKDLLGAMVGRGQPADPGPSLVQLAASGRYAEIEAVGREVRRLIQDKVPPRRIGIVFRQLGGLNGEMMADVAHRYAIPLNVRRGQPLKETGLVRAVLAGLSLAEKGGSRAELLRVVECDYLKPWLDGSVAPGRIVAAVQASGMLPGQTAAWPAALKRLAQDQNWPEAAASAAEAINRIVELFQPFRRPGRLGEALNQLQALVSRMNLAADPPDLARRDRAVQAKLMAVLKELAGELGRMNRLHQPASAAGLQGLINRALADQNVDWSLRDLAGVRVMRLEDVRGLDFDHLFLVGLVEGEWPLRAEPDPFLSDQDKMALNQALGLDLFTTSAKHFARERLLFLQALAATRARAHLSWHQNDQNGRPTLESWLLFWVKQALVPGIDHLAPGANKSPPLWPEVLAPDELLERYSLDLSGPTGEGAANARAVAQVLADRPGWTERLKAIARRVAAEQVREDYLLNPDRSAAKARANAFVGRLAGERVGTLLSQWFSDPEHLRMRHQALESFANCGFRFLAEQIWGLEPRETPGLTPSPREMGLLAHDLLRAWHQKALEADAWPPDAAGLEAVAGQVMERWQQRRVRSHGAMARALAAQLKESLARLVDWEKEQAAEGWRPWRLEWAMPDHVIPLAQGGSVTIPGRADRIDRLGERLRIIDYKTGTNESVYARAVREANQTAFQLPIYLAALAKVQAQAEIEAAFLMVRRAKLSKRLAWDEAKTARLKERINELVQDMRGGRFDLDPRHPQDCDRACGLRLLCRYQSPWGRIEEGF